MLAFAWIAERQIEEALGELPLLEEATTAARAEVEAATTDLVAAQLELQSHQSHLQEFRVTFEGRRTEIAARQAEVARLEGERQRNRTALAQAEDEGYVVLRKPLDPAILQALLARWMASAAAKS